MSAVLRAFRERVEPEAAPGLKAMNFRKVARNGFGDARNCYPHSMAWFEDHLYVGTTRSTLAMTKVAVDELGRRSNLSVWPVKTPANVYDNDLRAQIWRYTPRTGEWQNVFTSPLVTGRKGFDVPLSIGFRNMTTFQGASDPAPALYVPTWATSQRPETVLLRSLDGTTFEIVSEPGLGLGDPLPRSLRAIIPFKGRLFTAPAVGQKRGEGMTAGRMTIVASADPARGGWEFACQPGFGDPSNLAALSFAVFNGFLYAGTTNIREGFQVWKTDAEGPPPFRWTKVLSRGAYRGRANQIAMTLHSFRDHIYVGSGIQSGGYDIDNGVGPAAPEVIRVRADDTWELVVGEPRITPDGVKVPLSGLGPGFGNITAGYIWEMCEHDGWLYVGDAVWAMFMRYSDVSARQDRLGRIFDPGEAVNLDRFLQHRGGFDLWRSRDGVDWSPVTENGFGNPYNLGVRRMVSTGYGLFVGAANSFGPEVAVNRRAGWTYEWNPASGLEIWLGELPGRGEAASPSPQGEPPSLRVVGGPSAPADLVDAYYGGSGFRHVGFWRDDIDDAKTACENLMDELLAFIPDKRGGILDVGCGRGATTRHLLKHYPAGRVKGVCVSREELAACRKSEPAVGFSADPLPRLRFRDGAFEAVICVEGPGRLGVGVRRLIREMRRVLKPNGHLVCADMPVGSHVVERKPWWEFWAPESLDSPEAYRCLLESEGFREVRIIDVTQECWTMFRKHSTRYLGLKLVSGAIDVEGVQEFSSRLPGSGTAVECYVLMCARRA